MDRKSDGPTEENSNKPHWAPSENENLFIDLQLHMYDMRRPSKA